MVSCLLARQFLGESRGVDCTVLSLPPLLPAARLSLAHFVPARLLCRLAAKLWEKEQVSLLDKGESSLLPTHLTFLRDSLERRVTLRNALHVLDASSSSLGRGPGRLRTYTQPLAVRCLVICVGEGIHVSLQRSFCLSAYTPLNAATLLML